jgi:hypothetical protein
MRTYEIKRSIRKKNTAKNKSTQKNAPEKKAKAVSKSTVPKTKSATGANSNIFSLPLQNRLTLKYLKV